MLSALVRIRKYSGVLLSPSARMMAATMLYKKDERDARKNPADVDDRAVNDVVGRLHQLHHRRVSATVLMVSTTLPAMQSHAALATWRRRSL